MPPIDDAKLAETMAKYYPDLVCKYYPDHRSYTPPPTSKPPRLQESMVNLADSMAKLEIASKHLATSTAHLISLTIQTTTEVITETKTTHVVTDTSSLVTKINKPENTILKLLTDPTVQNEVFAQIPFSPLSGLPANPSHKTSKLRNYITIFPQTTIHETYGVATFIDDKLPIFGCLELFPISGQCHPPKFVFLEPKLDPPWEPHDRHYETMSLEDKTRFKTGSIDTSIYPTDPTLSSDMNVNYRLKKTKSRDKTN
ncbi:hypothetical protein Tco_1581082 [Tanacetum coccineum]